MAASSETKIPSTTTPFPRGEDTKPIQKLGSLGRLPLEIRYMIYELLLTRSDIVFGFNRSRLGSFKRSPFSDRSPPNPRFNINILRASRGIFEEANPFIIKSNEFYLKVSPWSDCGLFDASSAKLEFFPLRHIRRFVLDIKTHKLVEAGWQEWLNAHETTEFFKPMEQLQCLTVRLLDRDFGGGSWSLSILPKRARLAWAETAACPSVPVTTLEELVEELKNSANETPEDSA